MADTPKTIILKGKAYCQHKEAPAGGAITPGMLLKRNTSNQFVVHATAAGNAQKLFALENDIFGKQITDAYAANDQVIAAQCPPGTELYGLLKASSAAVVIGDYLESGGDGTLQKQATNAATADTQRAGTVAIALEAVTPGGSATRCKIEIL